MTDTQLQGTERPKFKNTRVLLDANPRVGAQKIGSKRFWTTREIKILKEKYPVGGVDACLELLPGRSATSIYQRAAIERLSCPKVKKPRQRWATNERIDRLIREVYESRPASGEVQKLAQTVGRPRRWVYERAKQLGFVAPRFKEPPWSEEEIELVSEDAHKGLTALQRKLRRAGFKRSQTAIKVKLKRLQVDRSDPDHYTAHGLASIMGVDAKTVTRWIERGLLKADRRGTGRKCQQGGDMHWIAHKDVRNFIADNAALVDIRKCDKFWLIDLLVDRRV